MAERRPSAGSSALNAIAQFNAGVVDNTLGLLDLGAQGVAGISNMITGRNDRPVMLSQRAKSALNVESDPSSPSYIAGSVAPAVATGVGAMAKQGLTSLRNVFGGSTAELGGYFGGEAGAQLGREYGGDYGELAGGLVGGMAAPNAPRSEIIDAYHGSPHEFEQFSMDKIGTGAGQQVYGHGIYFSENPEIARPFSERTFEVNQSLMPSVASFFENDYSLSKARAAMKSAHPNATNTEIDNSLNEYYMHLDDQGYMYNANLNVEPEDLLDFDAPLSQQPEAVKRAAEFYNVKTSPSGMKEAKGSDVYRAISQARQQPPFDNSSMNAGGPEASAYLNELGIKGIKYKARGEDVSNYVIFDDSLVDTKRVNDKLTPSWMDQGARMQRAQDQGFLSEIYYHGTNEDFGSFDPNKADGSRRGSIFLTDNPAVASTYATVANKKNVMPLRIRPERPVQIYANGANWNKLTGDTIVELPSRIAPPSESERLLSQLKGEGIPPNRQVEASRTTLKELFPESFGGLEGNYMNTNDLSNFAQYEGADSIIFHDIIDIGPSAKKGKDAFKPSKNAVIFEPEKIRSINAEFDPAKADSADLLSSRQSERQMSALRGIA